MTAGGRLPRRLWALGVLVGVVCAAPIGAQPARGDTTLAPKRLRPVWRVGAEGSTAYESNVLFGGQQQETGDQYHRVGGSLTGGIAGARSRLELEARGDIVRFAVLRVLDRETYDVGATLSRKWSSRVATQLAGRAMTSTMSMGVPQLNQTLLPLTITRTQSGVASIAARLSPFVDLTSAVDYSRVRFDDTTFVGGATSGGMVALSVRPTSRTVVGVVADTRVASFNRQDVGTALLEGDVKRDIGRTSLRVRAGATVLQTLNGGGGELLTTPTGSFELLRRVNTVALTLRGARAVTPAFGFGRALQTDQFAASIERAHPRGSTVRLSADASRNEDPTDPRLSVRFASVNGEWRRPMGGGLTLAIVGFARRRLEGVRINNTGGSLIASFGGGR